MGVSDFTAITIQLWEERVSPPFFLIWERSFNATDNYVTIESILDQINADRIQDYTKLSIGITGFGFPDAVDFKVTWTEFEIPDIFIPPVRATIDSIIHPRNVDSIIKSNEETDSTMNV